MDDRETGTNGDSDPILHSAPSFKPYSSIFEEEIALAVEELKRPAFGLLLSGFMAGVGVGVSVLLLAIAATADDGFFHPAVQRMILANLYSVGFVLVIMSRTDLFTEYTTMAVMPVLAHRATSKSLIRLWSLIYVANLIGAMVMAAVVVTLGPGLEIVDRAVIARLAMGFVSHTWWVILLSAVLAGWLMGLLSWLLTAARETVSQILLIWIVGSVLGFVPLHHVVTGFAEVAAGYLVRGISMQDMGFSILWATIGNGIGGFAFAALIDLSVVRGSSAKRSAKT